MAEPAAETPVAEAPPAPSWRRRVARLLLVAGIALAASQLLGRAPHDQSLEFRLGPERSSVRRIDATWTPTGEREAAGGVTLRFDRGAPQRVLHRVSLPNGSYELAIEVTRSDRSGGLTHTTTSRRVRLEGGETVIPLESR
jgi:hypothetical protein